MSKKGGFVLDVEEKAALNAALVSLGPSFNQSPYKQIFAAVEKAWADSFSSAFLSTVVIFGGIVVAVFLVLGVNTSQSLHWVIKEYSDNVADVCSVITIAYLAYTYRQAAFSATVATLSFKEAMAPNNAGPNLPKLLQQFEAGRVDFTVYAVLVMLAVMAPVAAVTYFLFDGTQKSFQVLLQHQFDEVSLRMRPRSMMSDI
jgi:hypothetical protein